MMEQCLIDANALADKVNESRYNNPHPQGMVRVNHRNEHDHFLRMILDAPTVDAVEVVRCKDCKHRSSDYDILGDYLCEKRGCRFFCKDNDFCSYGERRDSDG